VFLIIFKKTKKVQKSHIKRFLKKVINIFLTFTGKIIRTGCNKNPMSLECVRNNTFPGESNAGFIRILESMVTSQSAVKAKISDRKTHEKSIKSR
jgi:hypothetical protein